MPRALLVVALVAALAGCGGTQDAAPPAPPAETAASGGSAHVAGTTLDGEPISLDDFRGRPVLVNVWSSW